VLGADGRTRTAPGVAMVFERVDMFNEEIEAAREGKRKPVLTSDFRHKARARYTGVATQHPERVTDQETGS
jgi:hypothetical protein